jgi:hypothetical protein
MSTVHDYLRHGYDTESIIEALPGLTGEDVDEARRLLAATG